jgi:beta-lactamase class A
MMEKELSVLKSIVREMETIPGHLGFYYKNLVTGLEFGVNEADAFLAASVIKFPLLLHVLTRAAKGEISLSDRLVIEDREKMPSCGGLNQFTGPVDADILTLCRLMIVLSDNTATNKLFRFCGMENCNAAFREMGLEATVLRRLLFDAEASARGLQNTVSPREMGMLLERLYRKDFVSPEVSDLAMEILLRQQIDHKLGGKLFDAPIAHKTGEDDGLSNDVGIVFAKEPFVICFAGHDTDVYRWEDLMRRAAYDLVHAQTE